MVEDILEEHIHGINNTPAVLQTSQAKKMLEENNNKNNETKKIIEDEISNITLASNENEIQEIIKEKNKKSPAKEENSNVEKTNFFEEYKDYIILGSIGIAIIICVIVIIITQVKRKSKGEKNGREH